MIDYLESSFQTLQFAITTRRCFLGAVSVGWKKYEYGRSPISLLIMLYVSASVLVYPAAVFDHSPNHGLLGDTGPLPGAPDEPQSRSRF